jgi:hypothetical protein
VASRRTYAGRAIGFARRQTLGIGQRVKDQLGRSYSPDTPGATGLIAYLRPFSGQLPAAYRARLAGLTSNYLAHRFDLLGSGWVQVRHGMDCPGVEGFRYRSGAAVEADAEARWLQGRINRANLPESQRIWRLISSGYRPIDWQLDFKSGFRWSEETWYLDVRYGHKPGVDIKVPWELARMQHLPQLAWAYHVARGGAEGFAAPQCYPVEFRNQVLDFMATNPPRFGVNWRSAMEVAIRAVNWVIAADLFRAGGARFDKQFETLLSRSLYEHGLYIEANLEWDPEVRGNHYLANVAGLLLIGAYLPPTSKTQAWLAFAIRELINEVDFQFAPDGTHREASTSYHRLTAEIVVYATAFALALPESLRKALNHYDHSLMSCRPALLPAPIALYPLADGESATPFPPRYFERLERMGEFIAHITKPGGQVPQVGDNDSGRFLRLNLPYQEVTVAQARARYSTLANYDALPDDALYWDEDHLDHRGVESAIGALFGRDDLLAVVDECSPGAQVIRGLTGAAHPASYRKQGSASGAESVRVGSDDQFRALGVECGAHGSARSYEMAAAPGVDLREGLACYGYPDFGLYIFRSGRLYLSVRCGRFGLVGNGGHAHHDQLSIELSIDGRDLIVDPGTYLYTALKERRNQYRAADAHFAPHVAGREAPGTGLGLFEMRDRVAAKCLYFGTAGFAGCHAAYGVTVYRIIEIGAAALRIIDAPKGEGELSPLTPVFGVRSGWRESLPPSPGYGIVRRDLEPISG